MPQLDDRHGVGVGARARARRRARAGRARARRSWPAAGRERRVARADDDEVARPQAAARRAHLGEALGREARVDGHEVDAGPVPDLDARRPSPPIESALTGTASTAPFVLLTAIVSFTEAPTSDGRFEVGTTAR